MDQVMIEVFAQEIISRLINPVINGINHISKECWDTFKIEFDIAFKNYLKYSYDKYSNVKTI